MKKNIIKNLKFILPCIAIVISIVALFISIKGISIQKETLTYNQNKDVELGKEVLNIFLIKHGYEHSVLYEKYIDNKALIPSNFEIILSNNSEKKISLISYEIYNII